MTNKKKSFVMYVDYKEFLNELNNEQFRKLFDIIFDYVENENEPDIDDVLVRMAWKQIGSRLKQDIEKWNRKKEICSNAGKKSGETRRNKNIPKEEPHVDYWGEDDNYDV